MQYLDPPPPTQWNFLSLGAGVQSSALALMAAHGEVTPMPDAAIFADTQSEPEGVYKWLDWLEGQLPFPVHKVTAGNLADGELRLRVSKKTGKRYSKNSIPAFAKKPDGSVGILGRKCTSDFKIAPIHKIVRQLAEIKRGQKIPTVTMWIGISWDEAHRMKESRNAWMHHRWPMVEIGMRRDQCHEWMRDNGYPPPPRSACTFCPFHSDSEWRRIRDEEPSEWEKIKKFERDLQKTAEKSEVLLSVPFLHPSCKPIGEADIRSEEERGQLELPMVWNTIQNECEGMCGV